MKSASRIVFAVVFVCSLLSVILLVAICILLYISPPSGTISAGPPQLVVLSRGSDALIQHILLWLALPSLTICTVSGILCKRI